MIQSEINLPTPMTTEAHRAIQGVYIDSRLFAYGPNDWGTAAWYNDKYPGFMEELYRIFEMYFSGMTTKQYRNALKKASKNSKTNSKCSR
jgi:hypothetical protein